MNVVNELRNEATGVYGRQPEWRYQILMLTAVDEIERLGREVERLRAISAGLADSLRDMRCPNCDDIRCSACVAGDAHEGCVNDCPTCGEDVQVTSSESTAARYKARVQALDAYEARFGRPRR